MPRAKNSMLVRILFALASAGVIAANALILLKEYRAGDQLEKIENRLHPASVDGAVLEDNPEQGAVLAKLEAQVQQTAERLAALQTAPPVILLGKAETRLRQLAAGMASVTQRLVDLSMIPEQPQSEARAEPRILYANYDPIGEFLEMTEPPNTASNPATYTFTISYDHGYFPEKKFGGIKRGQLVGAYQLEGANVETRQGAVVQDEIVRYRRRKGGVREPVWSYKRQRSKQVVVVDLVAAADRSRHTIHFPASERGEQSKVQREVAAGWVEIWENEEACSSRFPVMRGSEFFWNGVAYRVDEVTPQALKLTAMPAGERSQWRLGGGP